jgi:hypothetical protein
MIKYVSTIKEWRDRINGNTYFSAQIEDVKNGKKQYLQFQYGYGSHAEYTCKKLLGLKGFNSSLPIKFITIPNCKQRDVKKWGVA